jgi:hypothetical protein
MVSFCVRCILSSTNVMMGAPKYERIFFIVSEREVSNIFLKDYRVGCPV